MAIADYCNIAEHECLNPAGFSAGGGYGDGYNADPPRTRTWCWSCGEPACRKCRAIREGHPLCLPCVDDHDRTVSDRFRCLHAIRIGGFHRRCTLDRHHQSRHVHMTTTNPPAEITWPAD